MPGLPADKIIELSTYLSEAWGNRERIDYGSGMELNFLCWLCVCNARAEPSLCSLFVASSDSASNNSGSLHRAMIVHLCCVSSGGALFTGLEAPIPFIQPWLSVPRYIGIMRNLQSTYWLEPAGAHSSPDHADAALILPSTGSHGVWGLDDYHFLPFLFGSAQLAGHRYLRPKSIHDADVLEGFADDYMYLACIQFINSVSAPPSPWSNV